MAAITAAEVLFKYSVKAGAAGNSTASTAGGALGKYISTTVWPGGALNDLYDDVSGAENAASTVDYRCVFIHNSNTANSYQNVVVYLSAEVAGGTAIAIATDNLAASAIGAAAAQAAEVATETTAPVGTSAFSSPTTIGTGLALGTLAVGQTRAIWIRRTASNSAALSADGVTVACTGDTGSL